MKLEDKLRSDGSSQKLQRPPATLQGVTKERIAEVLHALDRESKDRVDTLFALLDDINPNYKNIAPGTCIWIREDGSKQFNVETFEASSQRLHQ